ncbi:MAG: hypothetical protein IPP63_14070 [Chloracidobacterium sp.]|nr:hypothetical protein [Chloracidobacterium sp.]
MGLRKPLIFLSIAILFAGLFSAVGRQVSPGGTEAFNLGVDFQGGTVITAKFRNKPAEDDIRNALQGQNIADAVIQSSLDKQDEVLIKVPLFEGLSTEVPADGTNTTGANATQVNAGREMVKKALDTFGKEAEAGKRLADDEAAAYQIVGTDSVGPVAGAQLRNQAVIATLLGLVGILLYIAFRYD